MTVAEAIIAVPLWVMACTFLAVVVARVIRFLNEPVDPENPNDQ